MKGNLHISLLKTLGNSLHILGIFVSLFLLYLETDTTAQNMMYDVGGSIWAGSWEILWSDHKYKAIKYISYKPEMAGMFFVFTGSMYFMMVINLQLFSYSCIGPGFSIWYEFSVLRFPGQNRSIDENDNVQKMIRLK